MTVQISMAGQAIVGWFSPPPGTSRTVALRSWPPPGADGPRGVRAGAFIVDTRQRGSFGDNVMWWWAIDGKQTDANTTDPHLLLAALADSPGATSFGGFRIEDGNRPDPIVTLRFFAQAQDPDRFQRYRAGTRLPWTVISGVTEEKARALLLVEHVQPIAPRWVSELIDQVTGSTAKTLLEAWKNESTSPPAARRSRRAQIAHQLALPELEPEALPEFHRRAVLTRLRAALKDTQLSLGGAEHTLWDWYDLVAAEENGSSTNPEMARFNRLGLGPGAAKGFAYVIQFTAAKIEFARLVKGTIAGFLLQVRKVPVDFVLDANGARKTNEVGVPVLADPKALDDEKKGTKFGGDGDLLIGVFADAGVGLGLALDSGLSKPDGGPTASKKDLGGDLLGEVTCYSSANLTVDAFDGAWFSIAAVKGPAAKVGNFVGFNIFSSLCYQFWLKDNTVLSAVATNKLAWKPPSLPSWELLYGGVDGIKSYIEGWTKGKGSVTLFEVSEGFGYVMRLPGALPPPPPDGAMRIPDYAAVKGATKGVVFFDVGSAVFQVGGDILKDGRYLLEVSLATMRGVLTGGPERRITIDGYTSPEQSRCYNQGLSEARALTVERAILDAFGTGLDKVYLITSGLGEGPSLKPGTGLTDPPDDPAGLKAFRDAHRDQVEDKWPLWRKAEVAVEGTVVMIGKTATPIPTVSK